MKSPTSATLPPIALLGTLLATSVAATDSSSPHAGQQERTIKALGADEQAELLDGKGMGLAKAAELNGYPGPRHVLDMAEPLHLTDAQRRQTEALFERMRDEAALLTPAQRAEYARLRGYTSSGANQEHKVH